MVENIFTANKEALAEKLAESLTLPLPEVTKRKVHGAVSFPGKATAIVGMRRAGKTSFLHQLRQERQAGGLARSRLPYINFEDERLAGLRAEHLGFLLSEYGRRVEGADPPEPIVWCFDEIQVVPGWERFVRRVLDAEQIEVIRNGSSTASLSREIATALRGRAWEGRSSLQLRGGSSPSRARSSRRSRFYQWQRAIQPGTSFSGMAFGGRFPGSSRPGRG
jgi:hypothetical protein